MNQKIIPQQKEYLKLRPFPLFIKNNFPFIENTYEAPDYYGLLCKVVEYLNNVITNENILIENQTNVLNSFNELNDLFIELKTYVDNYFENLDVQEEIDNKLDEMVEDGTLENLLSNYANITKIYETTSEMIEDSSHLFVGLKIQTLGFYELNDGGGAYFYITNSSNNDVLQIQCGELYANLLVDNDEINVKQIGAYGDNTHDDTLILQKAFASNYNVYIPNGNYITTESLTIPFNKIVRGENRKSSCIYGNLENDYIIYYGDNYNYNGYAGELKDLAFRTNKSTNKPKGIYLNSACLLKNLDIISLSQAINRSFNYIDLIKIDNVYIGYCVPNEDYIIRLSGNQDALEIDQLKVARYVNDTSIYNGLYINRCHGGSINNSIINFNIHIANSNAISINNLHSEVHEEIFKIEDSVVTFNNCFKWKNVSTNDINITSSNYDKICDVKLNNFVFYTVGNNYTFNTLCEEIDELGNNTVLTLTNCFRQFNFADKNRTTFTGQGILIKNNLLFNQNSGDLSLNGLIVNNVVKNNIEYNDGLIVSSGLGTISKSNIAAWKGLDTAILHYRAAILLDETRKLLGGFSNDGNVSDIDGESIPIIALNIQWAKNILLFRGSATNEYTSKCLIPNNTRGILLDNYYSVNGYHWEDIDSTNLSTAYKRVNKYKKIGENVIVEMDSIPTLGTWTKGDKVINSNISNGQSISWVFDGTSWISQGTYVIE